MNDLLETSSVLIHVNLAWFVLSLLILGLITLYDLVNHSHYIERLKTVIQVLFCFIGLIFCIGIILRLCV